MEEGWSWQIWGAAIQSPTTDANTTKEITTRDLQQFAFNVMSIIRRWGINKNSNCQKRNLARSVVVAKSRLRAPSRVTHVMFSRPTGDWLSEPVLFQPYLYIGGLELGRGYGYNCKTSTVRCASTI